MCPECPSAQLNCKIPGLVDPFMAVVQTQACAMGDNPDVPFEKQLHKFRQLDGSPQWPLPLLGFWGLLLYADLQVPAI